MGIEYRRGKLHRMICLLGTHMESGHFLQPHLDATAAYMCGTAAWKSHRTLNRAIRARARAIANLYNSKRCRLNVARKSVTLSIISAYKRKYLFHLTASFPHQVEFDRSRERKTSQSKLSTLSSRRIQQPTLEHMARQSFEDSCGNWSRLKLTVAIAKHLF